MKTRIKILRLIVLAICLWTVAAQAEEPGIKIEMLNGQSIAKGFPEIARIEFGKTEVGLFLYLHTPETEMIAIRLDSISKMTLIDDEQSKKQLLMELEDNSTETIPVRDISLITFTGISDVEMLPEIISRTASYPNPSKNSFLIEFSLTEAASVRAGIYNMQSQLIINLSEDKIFEAGNHNLVWDGRNSAGSNVSSGCYLFGINAGGQFMIQKLLLVK